MEEIDETDLIWSGIKGGQRLHDLYGHYPSLHDATLLNCSTQFEAKSISLTFEYNDLTDPPQPNGLTTRFILRWVGVTQANLRVYGRDTYGISFHKLGDLIQTNFDIYAYGIDGTIIAKQIEVLDIVEWNAPHNDEDDYLRLAFTS